MDYLANNPVRRERGLPRRMIVGILDKLILDEGMKSHYELYLKHFLRYVSGDSPVDVCDVGGADGWAISYESDRIRSKTVVDVDDEYKKLLEKKGVSFVKAELGRKKIPLPNASFDLVILNHVIEHVSEYEAAVSDVKRILKSGGVAVVRTPDITKAGPAFYNDLTHVKPYTLHSIRKLMESSGFETIALTRFNYSLFTLSFLLPEKLRPGLYRLFGKEILYVGRKPADGG